MFGICHDIEINANQNKVFEYVSTERGLEKWWSKISNGEFGLGQRMQLYFSEEYDWEMEVLDFKNNEWVSWKMTRTIEEWKPTQLNFKLISNTDSITLLRFEHLNWMAQNDGFRRASYCWAQYLRILKRNIELGEFVPYEKRTKG